MVHQQSFLLKRLMSITGMLPVGGFLLQHLFSNSYAFISPEAYNEHTRFLVSLPMVVLLEIGMIYLPIFLHAAFGVAIIYRGQNNFAQYSYFRNWMFFLQRLTGILALVFIATHSYTTRIKTGLAGEEMTFDTMTHILQRPGWFWFYCAGVISAVFHFSNGLWSFLVTWGITIGQKAQRVSSALTMGLFVLLTIWGISILLQFV
ncbi:MAG: succinate dehydrogenase [Deltaproteobacteria bacterium]|nr:succinate dehydrogenase [Deltaproteobacteria bacterium]MBI2500769.1 succinate dehydrogenase [Deltaproteobacteria bacterium]